MPVNVTIADKMPPSVHHMAEAALAAIGARGIGASVTLTVPVRSIRPPGFPRYDLMSVTAHGRNISIGAWNLLKWLSDAGMIVMRVTPDEVTT